MKLSIKLPKKEITTLSKGEVIKLERNGENLFYCGNVILSNIPSSMRRPVYYAVITDLGDDFITISIARFADIHRHSDCSLLDGLSKISDMAKKSVPQGAITDHGVMYGFFEFYKAMKKYDKIPLIGFEAYIENMNGELKSDHLILIAKNIDGLHNLMRLSSIGYEHLYREKPHILRSDLEKYKDGIIATSACIGGTIPKLIRTDKIDDALNAFLYYKNLFGDDFYLEIQRHGLKEEPLIEKIYKEWASEYGVKVIAATDSHYTDIEDAEVHEVALCLQTKKTLDEPHMQFVGTGYHIHSSEEMERLFSDWDEVLENTLELADKCSVSIKTGEVNLPNYQIPAPFNSPEEYFDHLCKEGYEYRFSGKPEHDKKEYIERYNYEKAMIKEMGFVSYFIIVWDYINFARSNGIYVGPGRGSAAGSIIAYCIGITDLDPIKYDLLFERFLNPERVSWPDVDTDFEHTRRGEVIEYVKQKYGVDKVCNIITFGTMAARMAVKDVGRVLGYEPKFCEAISKMIPAEPKMTIKKALKENIDLNNRYNTELDVSKIIDTAMKIEGCRRHTSQHACGIIISPKTISEFFPTAMIKDKSTGEYGVTSQVIMSEAEELSLLKMDMLGLKNLSAIHESVDLIAKKTGKSLDYHDIPINDRETLKFLSKGYTGGVFQLESQGMTKVVIRMLSDVDNLPDNELDQGFERMIAAVALYRPGPMAYIDDYIKGMQDPNKIQYDCPELRPILEKTYGIIVYQEQVMAVVQKLAGYTLGRADLVRKAMGKKKQEIMDHERGVFINGNKVAFDSGEDKNYAPGCINNGISKNVAEKIWGKMADFAKYAFNRSHAACYAYIAMLTAWLSCHYPVEFYTSMLNAFCDTNDKLKNYLIQADHRRIKVLKPDVNKSFSRFTVENSAIRFGLKGVKGLNKAASYIENERVKNGCFKSLQDFIIRLNIEESVVDRSVFESLLYSGAFDCFGYSKASLYEAYKQINRDIKKRKNTIAGQMSLFSDNFGFEKFDEIKIEDKDEYDNRYLSAKEFESLGFYLTNHPADTYEKILPTSERFQSVLKAMSDDCKFGKIITVGVIKECLSFYTKNEERMIKFNLETRYSSIPCVIFPRNVSDNTLLVIEDSVVAIQGKLVDNDDFGHQIIVDTVIGENKIPDVFMSAEKNFIIPIRSKNEQLELFRIIDKYKFSKGEPVRIYIRKNNDKELFLKKKKYYLQYNMSSIDELKNYFPVFECNNAKEIEEILKKK